MPYINGKKVPYNERGRAMTRKARREGKKVRYTESTYERIAKVVFESKKQNTRRKLTIKKLGKLNRRAQDQAVAAEKAYTKSGDESVKKTGLRNPSIQTQDSLRITQDVAQKTARTLHKKKHNLGENRKQIMRIKVRLKNARTALQKPTKPSDPNKMQARLNMASPEAKKAGESGGDMAIMNFRKGK
jgi:hypothetical protein